MTIRTHQRSSLVASYSEKSTVGPVVARRSNGDAAWHRRRREKTFKKGTRWWQAARGCRRPAAGRVAKLRPAGVACPAHGYSAAASAERPGHAPAAGRVMLEGIGDTGYQQGAGSSRSIRLLFLISSPRIPRPSVDMSKGLLAAA